MSNSKAIAIAERDAQRMRNELAIHMEVTRGELIALYVRIAELKRDDTQLRSN